MSACRGAWPFPHNLFADRLTRKTWRRVIVNLTDQTPSYESVEGYIAARTFAEGVRRSAAGSGKADRAGLQRAFESVTDHD